MCGFRYHGPKGEIGFAPRMQTRDFRAAFTAAEGWGAYTQQRSDAVQSHSLELAYGRLTLRVLKSELPEDIKVTEVHGIKSRPPSRP